MNIVLRGSLLAAAVGICFAFCGVAHARDFYKEGDVFSLDYTSIQDGTVKVLSRVPFEFRYSDDNAICQAYVANLTLTCKVDFGRDYSSIWISADDWLKIFSSLVSSGTLSSQYLQKLERIVTSMKSAHKRDFEYVMGTLISAYRYQLHDNAAPEAFHLTFAINQKQAPL